MPDATPHAAQHQPSASADIILEVKQVHRSFDALKAVNDCSLSVRRGTITGLIGPNGAGKTTLFNLITGFLKPSSGEIHFNGHRIDRMPPHTIFLRGLVRTFQVPRALGSMTVLENLMLVPAGQIGEHLMASWFLPGQVKQREFEIFDQALSVLKYVELIHLRDEYASNLSGGQKKLLELGRALMANPAMILLDEPGAGVNRILMQRLVAHIRDLCFARGITFLIIEHDMDLVARLCNPVIVMSEGAPIAEGTPEEVRKNEQVLEAYLGGQYR